jgi:hypothetical protein
MRGFYAISCQFLPICPHTGWRLERGRRPNILGLLADEAGRRAQPQPAWTAASWPTLRWSCLVRSRSGSERWSPNSAKRRVSRLAVLSPWRCSVRPQWIHEKAAGAPPWSGRLTMRHKGLPSPPTKPGSAGCRSEGMEGRGPYTRLIVLRPGETRSGENAPTALSTQPSTAIYQPLVALRHRHRSLIPLLLPEE